MYAAMPLSHWWRSKSVSWHWLWCVSLSWLDSWTNCVRDSSMVFSSTQPALTPSYLTATPRSYSSTVISVLTFQLTSLFFCPWLWLPESTHTHTCPFNSPLSGTTQVSRYQTGKTTLDFTVARDSEWQWHQLGHICKSAPRSRQITMPEPHHSVFIGQMPLLLPNQQRQNIKVKEKHGNC